jgi:hypothetical protein
LWRYSLKQPNWKATEIQGIDYSTFLFGLASLPKFLGKKFFEKNNDFFAEPITNSISTKTNMKGNVRILTNPAYDTLALEFLGFKNEVVDVELVTIHMQTVYRERIKIHSLNTKEKIAINHLASGVYFLRVGLKGEIVELKKFVKN